MALQFRSSVSLFHLFYMSYNVFWVWVRIETHACSLTKVCACICVWVCVWETDRGWGEREREREVDGLRVQTQRHSCNKILVFWESQSGRDGYDLTKEFSKMFPGANTILNNKKRFYQEEEWNHLLSLKKKKKWTKENRDMMRFLEHTREKKISLWQFCHFQKNTSFSETAQLGKVIINGR